MKNNYSKAAKKRWRNLRYREKQSVFASIGAMKRFEDPKEREKISKALSGFNNPRYLDGRSCGINQCPTTRPKHIRWAKQIRERDNYTCQECDEPGCMAHHIDYNQDNFNKDNGICLCRKCHGKTNTNRKYWEKHFKKIILKLKEVVPL